MAPQVNSAHTMAYVINQLKPEFTPAHQIFMASSSEYVLDTILLDPYNCVRCRFKAVSGEL